MLLNAHLSKEAQERHWHGCLPVFAAGICLEYAASSPVRFHANHVLMTVFACMDSKKDSVSWLALSRRSVLSYDLHVCVTWLNVHALIRRAEPVYVVQKDH